MRKIIFFIKSTFNERDYNRFGIEILKNRGFDIEFWDFTSLFRKEYQENYTPPDYLNSDYIMPIGSREEFFRKIKNLKEEIIVNLYPGNRTSDNFIYDALKKYNIHYGINLLGSVPELGLLSRLQVAIIMYKPFGVLERIFKKLFIVNGVGEKIFPNFILCGGSADTDKARYWTDNSDNTKLILAHALDYDLFLKEEKTPSNGINKNYAVFLDQYIPFHSDLHDSDACWPKTYHHNLYYSKINNFFSIIEQDLGLEVIIASSPRANYNDYFEGRKVIRGRTIQLIKHSNLVLAHFSLAIGFAVLYKKPLISITDKEYTKYIQLWVKRIAEELGNIPVDINKNMKNILIPEVNEERYNLYKENYIKMKGTPEKNTWEIFADYCEHLSM